MNECIEDYMRLHENDSNGSNFSLGGRHWRFVDYNLSPYLRDQNVKLVIFVSSDCNGV